MALVKLKPATFLVGEEGLDEEAYVLISQDEPKIEVYQRDESAKWLYEYVTGMDAEIAVALSGAQMSLSLAEIYRRVRWDEDALPDAQQSKTNDDE